MKTTELARFLKDIVLHPSLRRLDLAEAMQAYALTDDERTMVLTADPALLDAIGQAVRDQPAPERPVAVERLSEVHRPMLLDAAQLWLRLAPFQGLDGAVQYAVGVAGHQSLVPPETPDLEGNPLPPVDLTVAVQPTLHGTQLSYASSLLPRHAAHPAPRHAQRHRSPGDPEVQAAVHDAIDYEGVLRVIDVLLTSGGEEAPVPTTRGRITLLGTGMRFPDHVTVEAERAIRNAREVLVVDTGIATLDWMQARCANVTPLLAGYVEGDTRLHTYHHFVATTVTAALRHTPVVFAMSGHPLIAAYAPFLLADVGRAFGFEVVVQPGISAFASILAMLEIDPMLTGLQLHEATDLVLQRRPLQADVPVLVFQIGTLGSLLHSDHKRSPEELQPLIDHLLHFFPPSHTVSAVYVSPHPLVEDVRHDVPLGDLASLARELHAGFSLFIPALHGRLLGDAAMAAGLT